MLLPLLLIRLLYLILLRLQLIAFELGLQLAVRKKGRKEL